MAIEGALVESHDLEQFASPVLRRGRGLALDQGALGDDPADPGPRVERGEGVLEDHLDLGPEGAHRRAAQGPQVAAVQDDLPVVGVVEADDAAGDGGLARTALADDAQGLAAAQPASLAATTLRSLPPSPKKLPPLRCTLVRPST